MAEAVIMSAARTPIGRAGGALRDVAPEKLGALVLNEAVMRSKIENPLEIEEIIFGHVLGAPGCMARVAALEAGLPMEIPGLTLDRQCGSGSTAVNVAAAHVMAGAGDLYVAGGTESMSQQPWILPKPTQAYQRFAPVFYKKRPLAPEAIGDPLMGITAENIVERWEISREEQDEFAALSQEKAARALSEGRFREQIVPFSVPQHKALDIVVDTDEHPRPGTTAAKLAKLPPAFKAGGTVTAGNSSGINDGAAAMVVGSPEKANKLGVKPMAKVVGYAAAGVDPNIMGIGPVPAVQKLMQRTGLSLEAMDVIELNEAFAAQSIACCRELGIDWHKESLNPNGGAIALGHPIAGSLAILMVKSIYELERIKGQYGLITACCGGGQGIATIIERLP